METINKPLDKKLQISESALKDDTLVPTIPAVCQVKPAAQQTLRSFVEEAINAYLNALGDCTPTDLHKFVMGEIEPPLIKAILRHTRGNQTKASEMLGLSRTTLRKKLQQYRIE